MGNTANKAQKFLLDNNCGDLILNDVRAKNAKDRIYASDIMMKFLEIERWQNVDTGERQLTIPDVIKAEGEPLPDDWGCGDIPLPNDYVKISTTKIVKGNGL